MKKLFFAAAILTLLIIPQKITRAETIPTEAYISGFIGHAQWYNLSCESRSASDWAAFFGFPVSEYEILEGLGSSDNPELGFVGSWSGVWGYIPPYSYGVHAPAIARTLRSYGVPALEQKNLSWDAARAEIAAGRPVIVWLIGTVWEGTPVEYTTEAGETVIVAPFEHSMTLIGYTEDLVYLVDSKNGSTFSASLEAFLKSWAVLENQAVIYIDIPQLNRITPETETPTEGAVKELTAAPSPVFTDTPTPMAVTPTATAVTIPPVVENATPTPEPTSTPGELQIQTSDPTAALTQALPMIYFVQPGDNIVTVAEMFGVTWQSLIETNGLFYPYFLNPGQVIILPAGSAPIVTETTAPTPTTSVP